MASQRKTGYELRVVLLLGLAYGFAFYDRMTMAFLSPFVVKDLGLNNTQVGALGSGLSLTWALGAYFIGRWSDSIGKRKPFLLAALLIFSLSSVLSGLSANFWTLLASRVIMGAAEGPFLPICLAIIAAASAPQRRGLNSGIVQNGFGSLLGNALAPLLVVAIAVQYGWRASFFTAGIPGLILLLVIWKYIDEPPAAPTDLAPPAPGEKSTDGFFAMLAHRNIVLCAIISCLGVGSIVLGSIFLPLFLTQVRGYKPETMANIMAILGLCPAIGGVVVTWLSDRIGRRTPMILFGLLMTLCPLAAMYVTGSIVAMTALMFVSWIGIGIFPLFMGVIPAETLAFRNTAAAMGIVVAIGEIFGGVFAPILSGWIADQSSLYLPLAIQAGMSLACGLVAIGLRETNPAVLARRGLATA
ncbi:MFS transporter [Sphingobium nicotianae]|uniref:MFS transporter n=1 Tax=Sphingobium nicotianae TaxID=2782607 RepID=A0A9X1DE43_9SPHN|nr:MFS transporter [Sphingobium nicotianae]MBT2188199.1 MFS transporter [Sphingobium nicotianae]